MEDLGSMICEVCREGASLTSDDEAEKYLARLPEWEIIQKNGIKRLRKSFRFMNFKEALEFTNKVGTIAEDEKHHPSILTEWGKVTITLWTHKIKGLHVNDFIIAAKIDQII